jgi:hypothetical protein
MKYPVIGGFVIFIILLLSGCTTTQQNNKELLLAEGWVKDPTVIFPGTTSTCSLMLPDGTIRTYLMGDAIYYKESADGKTFGDKIRTNIPGMQYNPTVVFVSGTFILFYNVEPGTNPDPAISRDIQLWRAESADGKNFSMPIKVGDMVDDPLAAIDVPDVIVLPDGRLRIYATQLAGEGGINTAVSSDLGVSWTLDGTGLVNGGAADPDVHIENGTKYMMYYTQTIAPEGMAKEDIKAQGLDSTNIMRATSADGIKWELEKEVIVSPLPEIANNGFVIDPDYVRLADGTEIIYFGKSSGEDMEAGICDVYRTIHLP